MKNKYKNFYSSYLHIKMKAFQKNGYLVVVPKDPHETEESFNDRGFFIVSQQPKNQEDLNEATVFSRIYVNCKNIECEYDSDITIKLNQMINKLN